MIDQRHQAPRAQGQARAEKEAGVIYTPEITEVTIADESGDAVATVRWVDEASLRHFVARLCSCAFLMMGKSHAPPTSSTASLFRVNPAPIRATCLEVSMAKPKLTPWFNPCSEPVRVGVYETDVAATPNDPTFQHWNGVFWGCATSSLQEAVEWAHTASISQHHKWRDLASPPKGREAQSPLLGARRDGVSRK